MSESIITSIVGQHFRPPAKALLACLPAGHPLFLRPEPTNEWDANAVQVLLHSSSLRPLLLQEPFFRDELEQQLSGQGHDVEGVLAQEEWHLGYLPRAAKGNKELEEWNRGVQEAIHAVATENDPGGVQLGEYKEVACSLSFDSAGKPTVIITWPPVPSAPAADGSLPPAGELPTGSTAQADLSGRPWLRLSEAKAGQTVETDSGFTCIGAEKVELLQGEHGLYFLCEDGEHYISGQADDGEHCVGIYAAFLAGGLHAETEHEAAMNDDDLRIAGRDEFGNEY